eukprot:6465383-Amphidinium_carterae.1
MALKRSLLAAMLAKLGEFTQLFGMHGEEQRLRDMIKTWQQQGEYADQRVLVAAAHLYQATVLVMDTEDRLCHVFTCSNPPPSQRVWILHYRSEHYEPIVNAAPSLVENILATVALHSWTRYEQDVDDLRGGSRYPLALGSSATGADSLLNATPAAAPHTSRDSMHTSGTDGRDRLDSKPGVVEKRWGANSSLCDVSVACWNVGSWRIRASEIFAQIRKSPTPMLLCLQETGLTADGQRNASFTARQQGLGMIHGSPCAVVRTKGKFWRTSKASGAGVATLFPDFLQVSVAECRNSSLAVFVHTGRIQLLMISSGPLEAPIYVMNVYLPSGGSHKACAERLVILDLIGEEIRARHMEKILVLGDFNCRIRDAAFVATLLVRGWRIPILVNDDGTETQYTYESGETRSLIDGFVVSPDVAPNSWNASAIRVTNFQHSLVSMFPLSCVVQENPYITVYSPKATLNAAINRSSGVDWLACEASVVQLLEPLTQHANSHLSDWDKQRIIDDIWKIFVCAFRIHVRHTCSFENDEIDSLPSKVGTCGLGFRFRSSPQFRQAGGESNKDPEDIRLARFVQSCYSYAKDDPNQELRRKLECAEFAWSALKLNSSERSLFLQFPWENIHVIQHAFDLYKSRGRRSALKHWRERIMPNGRPSKALYNWLKAGPPPNPLAVTESSGRVRAGPSEFFPCLRDYWQGIYQRDPAEATQLDSYMSGLRPTLPLVTEFPNDSPDLLGLMQAVHLLRTTTASGLDGWPPSLVPSISLPVARVLLHVFYACEYTARWPRQFAKVRVHLLPKERSPSLSPDQYRPISILSVFYRLWGRWRLEHLVRLQVFDQLHGALLGAIPGRNPRERLAHLLLSCEASQVLVPEGPEELGSALHVINLDAKKCFDLLHRQRALHYMERLGVPNYILRGLGGAWQVSQRHLSSARYIDVVPILSSNGVFQGCILSVLSALGFTHDWCTTVERPLVNLQTFVDDRLLWGFSREALEDSWRASAAWESENLWCLNTKKSETFTAGSAEPLAVDMSGQVLPHRLLIKTLGHDVGASARVLPAVRNQRIDTGVATLKRIQLANLPIPLAQDMLQILLRPQVAYGVQQRMPTQLQLELLKRSIKAACRLTFRHQSFEIIAALVARPHCTSPVGIFMATHIAGVIDALRVQGPALSAWLVLRTQEVQHIPLNPVGPRAVFRRMLQLLEVTESADGMTLAHAQAGSVHILLSSTEETNHFIRHCLRRMLLRTAAKRKRLAGADTIDIEVSTKLLRNLPNGSRHNVISVLSDALWHRRLKHLCGFESSDICQFCDLGVAEDTVHALHVCPAWAKYRTWSEPLNCFVQSAPLSAMACGLCPAAAPSSIKEQWPAFQQALASAWNARMHASGQLEGLNRDQSLEEDTAEAGMQSTHGQRVKAPAFPLAQTPEHWLGATPFSFDPSFYSNGREWNYSKGLWDK